ncbi:Ig-like domain-containing protein, partial [Verminephrobacter aporrectodeae]
MAVTVKSITISDSNNEGYLTTKEIDSLQVRVAFTEAVTFDSINEGSVHATFGELFDASGSAHDARSVWVFSARPRPIPAPKSRAVVTLNLDRIIDSDGNPGSGQASNSGAAMDTQGGISTVDPLWPRIDSISFGDPKLKTAGTTSIVMLPVTMTFNEVVPGLDAGTSLAVSGGTLSNFASPDGSLTWHATLTVYSGSAEIDDIIRRDYLGAVTDQAGNLLSTPTVPQLTEISFPDSHRAEGEDTTVALSFDKEVTGLTRQTSLPMDGGVLTGFERVDSDGTIWHAILTPETGSEDDDSHTVDMHDVSDDLLSATPPVSGDSNTATTTADARPVAGEDRTRNAAGKDAARPVDNAGSKPLHEAAPDRPNPAADQPRDPAAAGGNDTKSSQRTAVASTPPVVKPSTHGSHDGKGSGQKDNTDAAVDTGGSTSTRAILAPDSSNQDGSHTISVHNVANNLLSATPPSSGGNNTTPADARPVAGGNSTRNPASKDAARPVGNAGSESIHKAAPDRPNPAADQPQGPATASTKSSQHSAAASAPLVVSPQDSPGSTPTTQPPLVASSQDGKDSGQADNTGAAMDTGSGTSTVSVLWSLLSHALFGDPKRKD